MCIHEFEIPELAEKLNLPIISLSEIKAQARIKQNNHGPAYQPSILKQENPFEVLQVSFSDSKPLIMQQLMKLIKLSPEQMARFRHAQSELFDPSKRFLHHYLRVFTDDNITQICDKASSKLNNINVELHKIPFRQDLLRVGQSV